MDDNECLGCGYPMRNRGTDIEAYPGTKRRSGPGRCTSCASAIVKLNQQHRDGQAVTEYRASITEQRQMLLHWIGWRRARGIPPEGLAA